ncbi:MAG TPA: transporter [Nevskiaceae bacterium]|nr:transporter [Nevskiaceae bacterium]
MAALVVAAALPFAAPVARGAEGGLGNFPFGAQSTYAAYLPQPGNTSFFGYALAYSGHTLRDGDGNGVVPGFNFDVLAIAPRIVHTWKGGFAGFDLSSGFVLEALSVKISLPGDADRTTGPTLLGIEPLYLSRSFGPVRVLAGPLLYWPLGPYDEGSLANSTVNYRSLAFQLSSTWTPTRDWDISLNAAIEDKKKNPTTDYESGTQAGLTFGVGWRALADKRWDFGFSGFYTDQLNDDKIDGDKVPGGNRTKKFAIGPKLVYWIAPGAAIVAQWHRESDVEAGPEGDLYWLECAFPF